MSKKLDRDALTKLKTNYDAHSEWLAWLEFSAAEANNGEANDAADDPPSRPGTPVTTDARVTSEEAPPDTGVEANDEAAETPLPAAGSDAETAAAAARDASSMPTPAAGAAKAEASVAPPAVLHDNGPLWRVRESALKPLGSEPTTFSYEVASRHYVQALRGPKTVYRNTDPASWVQCCLRIFWPDDDTWYSGEVLEYRPSDGKHRILYHDDEEEEWLDLSDEEANGRVQWLTAVSLEFWPPAPIPVVRAMPMPVAAPTPPTSPGSLQHTSSLTAAVAAATGVQGVGAANGTVDAPDAEHHAPGMRHVVDGVEWVQPTMAESGDTIPQGQAAVGWRLSVYWDSDSVWDLGIVENYDAGSGKHRILFDDSQQEWVDLALHAVRWHTPNGRDVAAAARAEFEKTAQARAAQALAEAQREAAAKAASAPASVAVVCNSLHGELLVKESVVRTERHGVVSPTEFERLAGKGSAKKWKVRGRGLMSSSDSCQLPSRRYVCTEARLMSRRSRTHHLTASLTSKAGRVYVPGPSIYGNHRLIVQHITVSSQSDTPCSDLVATRGIRHTLIRKGQTTCLWTAPILYNKMEKVAKLFGYCTVPNCETDGNWVTWRSAADANVAAYNPALLFDAMHTHSSGPRPARTPLCTSWLTI
jgi:hypothetical protein